MRTLAYIDYTIIAGYLILIIIAGIILTNKASDSIEHLRKGSDL